MSVFSHPKDDLRCWHSLTHSLAHALTHSLAHSLTHSPTLTHSLTLVTHSPTHSLTHSLYTHMTLAFAEALSPNKLNQSNHSLTHSSFTVMVIRGGIMFGVTGSFGITMDYMNWWEPMMIWWEPTKIVSYLHIFHQIDEDIQIIYIICTPRSRLSI